MSGTKQQLLRALFALTRAALIHTPNGPHKAFLWERVLRRRAGWRDLVIAATCAFGARIYGSFPDSIHIAVYFTGVWEPAITQLYRRALRPGQVVIDVGANVGVHALLASKLVGPDGKVHAIEASPSIGRRLRQNLVRNGAHNVEVTAVAATAERGAVTVFLHNSSNLGHTTILPGVATASASTVETKWRANRCQKLSACQRFAQRA